MKNKITFTFAKKKDFKKLARCAYNTGAETFLFEDQTIPTNYGVYLSEYLDTVLQYPEYTGLTQPITINF